MPGPPWIAFSTHLEIKRLLRISFARSVTGGAVVIGRGVWVCPKELCARAERESQDRQKKYSHHLAIITFSWFSRCYNLDRFFELPF